MSLHFGGGFATRGQTPIEKGCRLTRLRSAMAWQAGTGLRSLRRVALIQCVTFKRNGKGHHGSQVTSHSLLIPSRALKQRLPPSLIVDVPLDRFGQAFFEIVARFPLQLTLTEGGIDGVTTVMPQSIRHKRDKTLWFAQPAVTTS